MKDLADMDDLEAQAYVLGLPGDELDKIPADRLKVLCCVKDCTNGPTALDYGIRPWMKVAGSWRNMEATVFFCSRHRATAALYEDPGYDRQLKFRPGPALEHLKPIA